MPYRAKYLDPKSLAQTPWSHDLRLSIWWSLLAIPPGPWMTWWHYWTRKMFTPSLENVHLGHPIIPVVRNAKLVCLPPKFSHLRQRTHSLKWRNVKLQHLLKGRLIGTGKPRLPRGKLLPSEPYLGRFLRCQGWMKKRKPKKIVSLRSTSTLDAMSSLSGPWQIFLKHMKKVLLSRVFSPRPAMPNLNSAQPRYVFILYISRVSQRADYIIRLPPPSLKSATTLSQLRLCSPHPLRVFLPCPRKSPKVELSPLRNENRSTLRSLSPPPPPAVVVWANYHVLPVPPPPSAPKKWLDKNLMGDSPHLHISLFSCGIYHHSTSITRTTIYISISQYAALLYTLSRCYTFFPDLCTFLLEFVKKSKSWRLAPIPTVISGSLSSSNISWNFYFWYMHCGIFPFLSSITSNFNLHISSIGYSSCVIPWPSYRFSYAYSYPRSIYQHHCIYAFQDLDTRCSELFIEGFSPFIFPISVAPG